MAHMPSTQSVPLAGIDALLATVADGPLVVEERAPRATRCSGGASRDGCSRNATGSDGLCTLHANRAARTAILAARETIQARGFTFRFVEFCEDATTPGFLGYYAGVTNHHRREVKVSQHKTTGRGIRPRDVREIAAIALHEAKHVLDPAWQCGNHPLSFRA